MSQHIVQTLGIDASQALAALKQLDSAYQTHEQVIRSLAGTYTQFNKSSKDAAKGHDLARSLRSSSQAAEEASKSIGNLAVSTALIGRILTTQIVVSMFSKAKREIEDVTQQAAEFQRQVALIQTIAGGPGFDQIAAAVRNVSDNFNIPLLQAAEGVYNALSNQVGTFSESLEFAGRAALFAKATNSSLRDSVDLLSGAIASFGLTAADTDRVSSIFFTAIDKGRVTAAELSNTFGRIGPLAKAAGLNLEETAAAIASISVKGSKTSESLTQLRSILTGLVKPTPALRKELEKLNFAEAGTAIATLGLSGTLEALHASTRGSQQALGELLPNVRGLSGELALSDNEFKTLIANIKEMESQGREFAATKAIQVMSTEAERVSHNLNLLKNELTLGVGTESLKAADNMFRLVGGAEQLIKVGNELIPVLSGLGATLIALNAGAGVFALLPAAIGAGASLGRIIDDSITANLLKATKALEEGNKGFLADQKALHAERLDAARKADQEIVDSAQRALAQLNGVYITDLNNARAADAALVASAKQGVQSLISSREQLVQELSRAAEDSARVVEDSAKRIQTLRDQQSDRDFGGRISGLSDVQQFAALAKRSQEFAAEAARLLSTAVDPKQIERALQLFGKAQGTGEQAKSIADRTKNRGLNAFNRIIAAMNLDATHQGEQGWLHGLLAYAASDYEGADTFSNPVTEALRRLEARGVGRPTLDRIRQLLHTLENGFNEGSIR